MIRVHALSPQNELAIADRLRRMIETAWPGSEDEPRDRIDIMVGVRVGMDIDILVIVDLHAPRDLMPQRRRTGTPGSAGSVQHAIIAIEVKQLDVRSFARIGTQLFPIYDGKREPRSAGVQATDGGLGMRRFIAQQQAEIPYVYSLAWLTEVDDAALTDIEPNYVGADATWPLMIDACAQQSAQILAPMAPMLARMLPGVRERLLNRRLQTKRDAARVDWLAKKESSPTIERLLTVVGKRQVQLVGRGGSGKTTTLALLAIRLAALGERVLILTFHRTLRSDIAHLIGAMANRAGVPMDRIGVDTTMNFLLAAITDLGGSVPLRADGTDVDWTRLDASLDEVRALLIGGPDDADGDIARLRAADAHRFAWDHVFVDEAQDLHDQERDFLRALYGHRRLVLSDGLDQLVRRRVSCNLVAGVPANERERISLDSSLRMLRNVAVFAEAVAGAIGFDAWHLTPHELLPGGRVVIVVGDPVTPEFLRAVVDSAAADRADAADCLICVPAKSSSTGDPCREKILAAAASAGIPIWDGTDQRNRDASHIESSALRVVRYDSCRGLEGWITVALDLDALVAQKRQYPNNHPGDPEVDVEAAALRWMMIPITRAVHTLVISLRDAESPVTGILRDAVERSGLPLGVITWIDAGHATEAAALLAPASSAP
jgi:hypothetical protein